MAKTVEAQTPETKQSFLASENIQSPGTPRSTGYSPPPQVTPSYGPFPSEKPPYRPRFTSWLPARHTVLRLWLLESIASGFSLILFIVIIVILSVWDGREYGATSMLTSESEMKRPLIFPALSFTSAVMRASMLLPVASCIGQLKWSWFRRPQSLIDMERFDEASRGITGSLVLLWTVRFRHLAAVGAMLTILALPIDAFIQSSILLPQIRELNQVPYPLQGGNITNTTSFPKVINYESFQTMQKDSVPWASSAMINGIKYGMAFMTGIGRAFSADTPVNCPTGYCEFGKFQTLMINYTCVDRSKAITQATDGNKNDYLTIPGTDLHFYNNGGKKDNQTYEQMFIAAQSYRNYSKDIFGTEIGTLISRAALIANDPDGNWDSPVGVECAFWWGLSTLDGKVNQALNPFMNGTDVWLPWNSTDKPYNEYWAYELQPTQDCWVNNTLVNPAANETFYNEQCIYGVSVDAQRGLQNLMLDNIDGLAGDSRVISYHPNGTVEEWSRTNHFITNVYEIMGTQRDDFLPNIYNMFRNVAVTMTRIIQTDNSDEFTKGSVFRNVYRYHIEWVRLTLPAVMVAGSTIYFIVTAVVTAKERGWRRSNLPLLFHGFGSVERQLCGEVSQLADMENIASQMHVTIEDVGEGERVVSRIPLDAASH